jgi:hypothetical protein
VWILQPGEADRYRLGGSESFFNGGNHWCLSGDRDTLHLSPPERAFHAVSPPSIYSANATVLKHFHSCLSAKSVSQLVCQVNSCLDKGLGILLTLKESISKATGVAAPQIDTQAVIFGSSEKRNLFTFERRANEPFSSEKYFSTAAMQTAVHLELLETTTKLL